MNSNYIGISEDFLKAEINRLTGSIENLEARFNQIDQIVQNMSNSYNSNSSETFKRKYDDLRQNYAIIKANLQTYITDFNNLISSYTKFRTTMVDKIDSYTISDSMDKGGE